MKRFKALLTGILTATLLSVTATGSITANAQENTTGSITVTGTTVGETYTAYEVLEYTAVDSSLNSEGQFTDTNGTYKVAEEWVEFFTGSDTLSSYLTNYDGDYYVTGVTDDNSTAFASAIQTGSVAYIASHTLTNAGQIIADNTEVTFSGLDYGYYVIDSSLGAINKELNYTSS